MRIITGIAKGAKLKAPRGMDTRPTADRVKESIFNILGTMVLEATVLDLFAGTGNLGLEALSRGAKHAVFVDQSAISMRVIKDNAIHTKLVHSADFYKSDVLKAVDKLGRAGQMFDLIFCDPPYNKGLVTSVLTKIDELNILTAGGIIILEHSRHENIDKQLSNLQLNRSERYGETIVSFYIYQSKLE